MSRALLGWSRGVIADVPHEAPLCPDGYCPLRFLLSNIENGHNKPHPWSSKYADRWIKQNYCGSHGNGRMAVELHKGTT